ncbi:hypothetical protein [Neobacillus sp. PS3-40]|uniref:hypothetical protein n=1 Tax=Neobacillus sp. PS3-40 TaxID=3070679 RepID=UPI0027E140AE|nr:hypothetical protein [Neobacillus sp. PS3-40]WML42731.1 hypothetical protein RCG20_12875 [Neobacillus sp. PS3-40]
MGKIKTFLKRDSDFLRKTVGLVLCLPLGIYKVFFQTTHRVNSLIVGSILMVSSVFVMIEIVSEWKKIGFEMKRK